jgi:periplasmic protein TonB
MSRVFLSALLLSLGLHSLVLAVSLWLPRERALLPLFVDLTLSPSVSEPPGADSGAREASTRPPRRLAAAGRRAPAPPPAAVVRPAPSPPASSRPADAPPVAAPPPAAEPAAAPPVTAAPQSTTASVTAPPPSAAPTTTPSGTSTSPPTAASGGGGTPASPGGNRETGAAGFAVASEPGDASTGGGSGPGGEMLARGIPGDDGGAYGAYVALLRRRVQEALTYPSAARRRGLSGTVHLDIAVEPTGKIAEVLVVRSSSHEMLDAAALEAVRTLRQLPFPPGVRPRPVRVRLPVVFELR